MAEVQDALEYHESNWRSHEAAGWHWQDPNNPQKQRLAFAALKALGPPENVRILDYGCGQGHCAEAFRSSGYQTWGVDISETVIKRNRERLPDIHFELVRLGSAAPFENDSFDAIFCSEVIEHIYDVDFIFQEFARLVRPGGLVMLTTPYHGLIKNIIVVLFAFEKHFNPTWQHIRFFTKRSLSSMCLAHGLQPVVWTHVGRFWPVPKSFFVVCRRTS